MTEKATPVTERCPVCNISRLNGTFYWSTTQQPTTPDEVYNKVCIWAIKKGKKGCINSTGVRKEGLGWGESLTERTILGDDLKFDY